MCSIGTLVLSLDKIPDSCPIRTPDSYHIRTPCSNVIRTEYLKGGRTPDSLRIKVYRKEKVPQIFRFAGL